DWAGFVRLRGGHVDPANPGHPCHFLLYRFVDMLVARPLHARDLRRSKKEYEPAGRLFGAALSPRSSVALGACPGALRNEGWIARPDLSPRSDRPPQGAC